MKTRLEEIHPGEILSEEFMRPGDLTLEALAVALDLPIAQLNALVTGTIPVTETVAHSLGAYFKVSAQFWLNLQAQYNTRIAKDAYNA